MDNIADPFLTTAHAVAGFGACGTDYEALTDHDLVDLEKTASAHQRHLDAITTAAAGELARRSRRELGHAGLAAREGFRSPEAMLQSLTGATGGANQLVTLGRIAGEAEAAQWLLDDGVDDIGGEPVVLPCGDPDHPRADRRAPLPRTGRRVAPWPGRPLRPGQRRPAAPDRGTTHCRPRAPVGGSALPGGRGAGLDLRQAQWSPSSTTGRPGAPDNGSTHPKNQAHGNAFGRGAGSTTGGGGRLPMGSRHVNAHRPELVSARAMR